MVARWSHIVDRDSGRQIKVSQGMEPALTPKVLAPPLPVNVKSSNKFFCIR